MRAAQEAQGTEPNSQPAGDSVWSVTVIQRFGAARQSATGPLQIYRPDELAPLGDRPLLHTPNILVHEPIRERAEPRLPLVAARAGGAR